MRYAFYVIVNLLLIGRVLGEANVPKSHDFPIGMFDVAIPNEKKLNYVKSLGIDYIHQYLLSGKSEEYIQRYLDMAAKYKLKVMMDVSLPLRKLAKGEIPESVAIERFTASIKRWKNHEALGIWYVYDEPHHKNMPPELLMKFHDIVKKETPEIPDAIALSWIKRWWIWSDCADILIPDYYPVRKEDFPNSMLNQQVEFYKSVSKHAKHLFSAIQCYGYPRYPNPIELRYILFSGLTHKTKGVFFWSYYRSREKALVSKARLQPMYLETTVKPILKDFKDLVSRIQPTDEICFVPALKNECYSTQQIMVAIWKRKKYNYILMINNWPTSRDISFPVTPHLKDADLTPFCSTRYIPNVKIKNGQIKLHALPWETFIWKTPAENGEENGKSFGGEISGKQ